MKEGYRILAVDPGTREVGVAVVALKPGPKPAVLYHATIRAGRSAPVPERLRVIYEGLEIVIARMKPDVVVVEDVFYGKNVRSALRIGEGRGVVLLAAAKADRSVVEYAPATIKQAVTGSGRASKAQVQKMICRLLDVDPAPDSTDAADALAIAFCHAQRIRGGIPPAAIAEHGRRRRGNSLQPLVDRENEKSRRKKVRQTHSRNVVKGRAKNDGR